jgi:hypothetical protein
MRTGLLLTCLGLSACGGGGGNADAPTGDAPPAELPAWEPGLPPAAVMGARRGLTPARGIIHLHSPYSHDACDGDPRPGGVPDEECLAHLRAALCTTRQDYAALTDHDDTMADEDFATLFSMRGEDEAITDPGGAQVAARLACPDGHRVLVTVGGENELMPIMLDRHPDAPDVDARHAIYNGDTAAEAQAFRDAGGLVWIPHSEQRTVDHIRDIAPTGMEVYQLHANIDPDIREDFLGLDPSGAIAAVVEFADTNPGGPEPDLAILSFLSPNQPSLDKWDELLGEGVRLVGSGGTDAHENALPITLADGERGDSYRRMLRWFANVVLTEAADDPAQIEADLARGRAFLVFEVFGTPVGFDVHATGAATAELGDEVAATAGATLEVTVPTVHELAPGLPAPAITGIIWKVTAAGRTMVTSGAGPTLTAPLDEVGAYRVEIRITPRHLRGYLRDLGPDLADAEYAWIYASPIYVR